MSEQLNRLRAELTNVQNELIEAEAELADRLAEINAFEFQLEAGIGHLIDKLEALEREVERYNTRIQIARNRRIFGQAHIPVEEQYRRTWQTPLTAAPTPPPQPLSPADETDIKQLYRKLARRFHPDLTTNESDRVRRTEKMAAVNNAYAVRSMAELAALAAEPELAGGQARPGQTEGRLAQALQTEISRCRRRLREIEKEIKSLRYRPSVEISLEMKAAQRHGRDLLAEMVAGLEQKIARKTVERDMLKAQFDQLGPAQGFINIKRK